MSPFASKAPLFLAVAGPHGPGIGMILVGVSSAKNDMSSFHPSRTMITSSEGGMQLAKLLRLRLSSSVPLCTGIIEEIVGEGPAGMI